MKKVNLPQGVRIRVEIKEELGVITEEFLNELERVVIEALPKVEIDFEKLGEIYHEGKMLRRHNSDT